jgi:glycosyltransferase involved in cell wall biosynthesis
MTQPQPTGPLHIVMLVSNDVTIDARVRKSAVSAVRAGARVTLLGLAREHPDEVWLDDVHLMRLEHDDIYTKGWGAARRRHRRIRNITGYPNVQELRLARLKVEHLRIDAAHAAASGHGLHSRVLAAIADARMFVTRARPAAQRRAQRLQAAAWRTYDERIVKVRAGARWRRTLPEVHDYEEAYGPVIDELAPDLIHAHDIQLLGVAAHAVSRARAAGRDVKLLYDAHEFIAGLSQYAGRTPRKIAAWYQLEREFIAAADRIITVSPQLSAQLRRAHHLKTTPDVVLNAPLAGAESTGLAQDVRAAAGVGPDDVLLVYSGVVQHARGVQTAIVGMRELPDLHLAIVATPNPNTAFCEQHKELARSVGVEDRVHWIDPVLPTELVAFLAGADVGVIPLLHFPSHEVALTNKQFEYLHAGLPLVVSDCTAQAEFVRERDLGAVHRADDPADFARAVREVVADLPRLSAKASDPVLRAEFTWEQSEMVLHRVYAELSGGRLAPPAEIPVFPPLTERPYRADRTARPLLGIGPANMAGQGWAWGRAVERMWPDVDVEVFAVERERLMFPADVSVTAKDFAHSARWQNRWAQHVRRDYTHLLMEAGRPTLGRLNGDNFAADVEMLRAVGIAIGLAFHGSEIRDPAKHAARYPLSPFKDPDEELTAVLQRQIAVLAPLVEAFDGPKFVSTPDLLDDVPDARWLPVVVDTSVWVPGEPPLQRERPLVVHAPSNKALKGTHLIEPVLAKMVDRGWIDYRRIEDIPPAQMPAFLRDADIVLDHFGIGNYGVVTCEAMASGRVSISHITQWVRDRVPDPIPTLEATPDTLETVIESVLDDRDAARATAASGPAFVRRWHDGRQSAAVLADFLGRETPAVG